MIFLDAKIDGSIFKVLEGGTLGFLKLPPADSLFILSLKESLVQCYGVSAKYSDAKNCKGIRAAVYKYAEEHAAYYSPMDRLKSIWYDDDTADLHIALWFEEKRAASKFHCFLGNWHLRNPIAVKSGDLTVKDEIEVFLVEASELSKVLLRHYNADDTESPVGSLEEFGGCSSSVESTVSLSGHFAQLQSIEQLSTFDFASLMVAI
jgi:hypothetical protein